MQNRPTTDNITEAEILHLLRQKLKTKALTQLGNRQAPQFISDLDLESSSRIRYSSESDSPQQIDLSSHRPVFTLATWFLRWVEIALVLGLLGLVGYGGIVLGTLNHHSTVGWDLPTLTPTPLIRAIVLPSGHTPPNSPGGARPRVDEVPSHGQSLVQAYANLPTPTSAPQQGVRIQISALKIDAPIIQGDGWEQLKKGVAQHIGTPNPGEPGNIVLSGHNDVYGEVFRYLDRLKKGDEITVYSFARSYTYIVEGWTLVEPDQVDVMAPTPDATLTLISCYPYLLDTQRIIVKAKLLKG